MKSCPVCGAGAFDDAEVCYGCLHRYGEKKEPGAQPTASACSPIAARRKTEPAPVLAPGVEVASTNSAAFAKASASAVTVPIATMSSAPEGAAWIVRLELPGDVSVSCSAASSTGAGREAAPEEPNARICDAASFKASARDLVIRFQPQVACDAGDRRRGVGAHGSHVRSAVCAEYPAPAARRP